MTRTALIQLRSTDDPEANLPVTLAAIETAVEGGAELVLTPEVTNCVSARRDRQAAVLRREADDPTLAAIREAAARLGVHVVIGSLALKGEADERFVNRCFVIGTDGAIRARYDKIHMYDADPSAGERYRESSGYRPGSRAVLADAAKLSLGLTICYDIRFPSLYRALAQAGAQVLTVPSAFSPVTGAAHWEPLLRARAIETGCYVLAPAQCGEHAAVSGPPRRTYGHSLAVSPWGEVLCDLGDEPGLAIVDVEPAPVAAARRRIPSLAHDRAFEPPG